MLKRLNALEANNWTETVTLYPHSVLQIRPPFCNLSLSTKRREGLYAGCDNLSCDYALPSGKTWPHCWWGVKAKCEAERCS